MENTLVFAYVLPINKAKKGELRRFMKALDYVNIKGDGT
jgi:hypothetical protein